MKRVKSRTDKEIVEMMEEMIKESMVFEKKKLGSLDKMEEAHLRGILEAAKIGSTLLENLKEGQSYEFALNSFENKLKSSIYELFKSEGKYQRDKSEVAKCDIAYYGSLVNSLQILKDKFEEFEKLENSQSS